jgi:hypothetical protein
MTWGMILPTPSDPADAGRASVTSVQFALEDGRVIESCNGRVARRSAPRPGDRVRVWYDQTDPTDVLVDGSEGRWSDRVFLIAGAVSLILGVMLAGVGR